MNDFNSDEERFPKRPAPRRSWKCALLLSATLAAGLTLAGCTTGSGGAEGFTIEFINVQQDQAWKLNRPIRIGFSQPVDFGSINLNTVNIRRLGGAPSAGEFYLESPSVVVFQPRCPLKPDYSDAGLLPGGIVYELNILGIDKSSALTVVSADGVSLAVGDSRSFRTPDSTQPADLFFDPVPQSPSPVVRTNQPADNGVLDATHIEIGGDPSNRVYFERDILTGAITLDPPGPLPLNKLSDPDGQVALILYFNQPVNPDGLNISSSRLDWQYENDLGLFSSLVTSVALQANCAQTGAVVRIEPLGIMPPGTNLRVSIAPEFSDIVGETNLLFQNNFALATTLAAPPTLADHFLEEFSDESMHEDGFALADPLAEWGDGELRHNFSFTGTGGTGGDFDWLVPSGQDFFFNTDTQVITGGPNFGSSVTVTVTGGVLDLHNMRIEDGARVKVTGTNPLVILASGTVEIFGELNVSGSDSQGVVTLNTTNIPEVGAPGQAGGGAGGVGSPLITASSPRGGNGEGAFATPDGGGQGGETGWNNTGSNQINGRRGAGGGGGRLGPDQPQILGSIGAFGDYDQAYLGLDAEPGFPNTDVNVNGTTSGPGGPFGGAVGASPFADSNPANDFYGVAVDSTTQGIVQGELMKPWAGAGGGAGGDASFVGLGGIFPQLPFNAKGDEKGAGGAGGGGSLHMLVLEDLVFGANGLIVCRGGSGGGGENTIGLNRVGGGSGGGSGGHVVIEVAGLIDMSLSAGASATAGKLAGGIIATGGQGGAGAADQGGAKAGPLGKIELAPHLDACPPDSTGGTYPTSGANACKGHVDGAGGDGGPGIIQLHAPSAASILAPAGKTLADVCKPNPLFFSVSATPAWTAELAPSFSSRSRSRSKWVALGDGGFDKASPNYKPPVFEFGGTDTATGTVLTSGGTVTPLPPILGPDTLTAGGVPAITSAFSVVLNGASLSQTLKDSPELLDRYLLQLDDNVSLVQRFDVVAASLNGNLLTLTVDSNGDPLNANFGPGSSVELQPAYFRISSDDVDDDLPDTSKIEIAFQITKQAGGLPDPTSVFPAPNTFTPDPAVLNAAPMIEEYRYVRFEVLFDIDALATGLSPANPVPAVDFLRIPFHYN